MGFEHSGTLRTGRLWDLCESPETERLRFGEIIFRAKIRDDTGWFSV